MIPTPTPDQAVHVLEILGEWTKRGWWYRVGVPGPSNGLVYVDYQHPDNPDPESDWWDLDSSGVNHFDALCQATTVMQMLLEEFPEKA